MFAHGFSPLSGNSAGMTGDPRALLTKQRRTAAALHYILGMHTERRDGNELIKGVYFLLVLEEQ